jgi:hypothetical protein
MNIKRYNEFTLTESMVDVFINSFDEIIKESDNSIESEILNKYKERFGKTKPSSMDFADFYHQLRTEGYDGILIFKVIGDIEGLPDDSDEDDDIEELSDEKSTLNKIVSDLKLNFRLVATFGFGIGAFIPIVNQLMNNTNLSVELTRENVVLLTLTALSIIYLEEKNTKNSVETDELTKDSKSMLEELRMSGIGDGIVKKVINCLKATKSIFSAIGKHIGAIIGGFMDMFAYASLLIPIMNGLTNVITKFNLNIDTMPQNFLSLTIGVGTLIAKHGISYLLKKLKGKLNISDKVEKEIEAEIETPTISKIARFGDGDSNQSGELIKEQ